jgi:hypothetical protein
MKSPDWQLSALGIPLTKLGYNSLNTRASPKHPQSERQRAVADHNGWPRRSPPSPALTPKPVAGMIDKRVIALLFEVVLSDLSRIDGANAPATKELSFPVA